jgi:hypothetical protein
MEEDQLTSQAHFKSSSTKRRIQHSTALYKPRRNPSIPLYCLSLRAQQRRAQARPTIHSRRPQVEKHWRKSRSSVTEALSGMREPTSRDRTKHQQMRNGKYVKTHTTLRVDKQLRWGRRAILVLLLTKHGKGLWSTTPGALKQRPIIIQDQRSGSRPWAAVLSVLATRISSVTLKRVSSSVHLV